MIHCSAVNVSTLLHCCNKCAAHGTQTTCDCPCAQLDMLHDAGARLAFGGKELQNHTVLKVYGATESSDVCLTVVHPLEKGSCDGSGQMNMQRLFNCADVLSACCRG